MWILPLIGYAGSILGFLFLTMAIASGLYYLSELVEEHTVIAKRLLTKLIYSVVGLHIFLWIVDGLPFWGTVLGVLSHGVYLGNMRRFPFVKLSDPLFILSCGKFCFPLFNMRDLAKEKTVLVLLDHWVWFRHFSHSQSRAYQRSAYYEDIDTPSFTMIASFFGLCVWLVPFALFVSLSAGDNVLPTMGTEEPVRGAGGRGKPQGMIKAVAGWAGGLIGDVFGGGKGGGL